MSTHVYGSGLRVKGVVSQKKGHIFGDPAGYSDSGDYNRTMGVPTKDSTVTSLRNTRKDKRASALLRMSRIPINTSLVNCCYPRLVSASSDVISHRHAKCHMP